MSKLVEKRREVGVLRQALAEAEAQRHRHSLKMVDGAIVLSVRRPKKAGGTLDIRVEDPPQWAINEFIS